MYTVDSIRLHGHGYGHKSCTFYDHGNGFFRKVCLNKKKRLFLIIPVYFYPSDLMAIVDVWQYLFKIILTANVGFKTVDSHIACSKKSLPQIGLLQNLLTILAATLSHCSGQPPGLQRLQCLRLNGSVNLSVRS